MGWEQRPGNRRYYIRRLRGGKRVCFKGEAASLAASADDQRRSRRKAQAKARQERRMEWDAALAPLRELEQAANILLAARLLAGSYRQHARGRWRLRRYAIMVTAMKSELPANAAGEDVMSHLGQLVARASKGDDGALAEIRDVLDQHPEIWRHSGNIARQVQDAWVRLASSGDPCQVECIQRSLAELRGDIRGADQDPLARLLTDRVVATHLMLAVAEAELAAAYSAGPAERREVQRRQLTAQHAFLQAQKALTTYRQSTRPRPSPVDMLQPQSEVRAGRAAGSRLGKTVGVG